MSLIQFIKRPAIREAFKTFAISERTPRSMRDRPLLVPNAGGPQGITGTAFDYMARFHLARELHGSQVQVVQGGWIAERAIRWICASSKDEQRWREALARARAEAAAYICGGNNLRDLANRAQDLAQLDVLHRRPDGFDPGFRPLEDVSQELIELLECFDPVTRLSPKRHCLLNPEFSASDKVRGADADLVVDDRLVELKTTVNLSVTLDHLLQLVGYAALQRMGGILFPGFAHNDAFQSVEIYYARHGQLLRWPVDELFPGDGFDRFCKVFEAEIVADERRWREQMRQIEIRRIERERRNQFDRDIRRIRKPRSPRALLRLLVDYKDELGRVDAPYGLHLSLFTAMRRTIRAYGATTKRPRYKKYESIPSEIAVIDLITEPLQLVRAFRRNKQRFIQSSRNPRGQNSEDQLMRTALLRTARRIIKNRIALN